MGSHLLGEQGAFIAGWITYGLTKSSASYGTPMQWRLAVGSYDGWSSCFQVACTNILEIATHMFSSAFKCCLVSL